MTQKELRRIGGDQPCNKNELKRKGICFICKGPWGPNHSCLSDTEEMTREDQQENPFDFQDEDSSSIGESVDFYEDTSEEHEQSYGVVDSNHDMHLCEMEEYDEQQIIPTGEVWKFHLLQ